MAPNEPKWQIYTVKLNVLQHGRPIYTVKLDVLANFDPPSCQHGRPIYTVKLDVLANFDPQVANMDLQFTR